MISIVIPTYNSAKFMPNLLDSIFKNKIDDMEVVIVDDLSTDDTVEIAKKYPVSVIELEKNGGPARARNIGVGEAKGDIIFFLDSDVVVMDGTIKEVEDYFRNDPSAQCVIGICATEPLNKGFVPKYMAMFEYIHLLDTPGNKVTVFAPRCGAIKKELFRDLGGYREKYKGADVEDFELARRICKVENIYLNPKILVRHQFVNNSEEAIKNYFKRAVMWIHLFLKDKQFDNAGPTSPSNGIAAICSFMSILALLTAPFLGWTLPLFSLLIVTFVFVNLRWWNFMRKEAGFGFAMKALALNYVLGIDIILASLYGTITYYFKKDSRIKVSS
ncbi:MAG: glycosyltransferase family 2 protein [Nitrospira sp.]|nr:glycosyltransferase family 2 protein [Nitrospira sp.]